MTVPAWLRRGVAVLSLLGTSCLVALLLAEGVVRLVAPQQLIQIRPDIWVASDTLGWTFRPGIRTEVNTGERTVLLRTDSMAFRVGPGDRVPAARCAVLLLGDSFMAALQVDHEDSLAGIMERELSRSTGSPVEVLNASVPGWGPNHYLLQARRVLDERDVALVVTAVFVGNDGVGRRVESFPARTPVERHSFRLPRSLSRDELVDALAYPVNDFLEVRSHLFVLAKNSLKNLLARLGLSAAYFPTEIDRSNADSPRWAKTAEILRDVDRLAAEHGAGSLFVLVPDNYQVDLDLLWEYVRRFGIDSTDVDPDLPNRALFREMEGRGLRVVDATPGLRAHHETTGSRLYGTVDTHLSPAGHRVLWKLVEPKVSELLGDREPADQVGSRRKYSCS